MSTPQTLFEKVWDAHVVRAAEGEPTLLYIDLHLVHEVTSPQAFDGLRANGRRVRQPLRPASRLHCTSQVCIGSKREATLFGFTSASTSYGHAAA